MRTFNPISRADAAPVISPNAAKVLRNTYMLLGITLLPTILGAFVGVRFNPLALMGLWSLLLFIPVMLGFQAMIIRQSSFRRRECGGFWDSPLRWGGCWWGHRWEWRSAVFATARN